MTEYRARREDKAVDPQREDRPVEKHLLQKRHFANFAGILILACYFLACGRAEKPPLPQELSGSRNVATEQEPVPTQSTNPATAGRTTARTPAPTPTPAPPEGFGAATVLPGEGSIVMQTPGFAISELEYQLGLEAFLAGRPATPELEQEYDARLRDDLAVLRWMEQTGRDEDARLRATGRRQLRRALVDQILEEKLAELRPTETELRATYQQQAARFTTPERVHVRMMLLPDEEEADAAQAQLAAGEPFGNVAAQKSRHASRQTFGELEPFARGTWNPQFEQLAFSLDPGQSGRVTTPAGVFLVEKIANLPATTQRFADVRQTLEEELWQQRAATARTEVVQRLREETRSGGWTAQ